MAVLPVLPIVPRSRPLVSALGTLALSICALGAGGLGVPSAAWAAGGVTITSYGNGSLMIRGGGANVLVNPFQAVACAAGLAEPRVRADVTRRISSVIGLQYASYWS